MKRELRKNKALRVENWRGYILVLLILTLLILAYFFLGLNRREEPVQPIRLEKITFGVETSLHPSLVWIAEHNGYFTEEGLEVDIKEFSSGRTALRTMLQEGGLDMVTVAQTPVMFNSFERNDYAIIAMIEYSYNDIFLLGRTDQGINRPTDVKGKKMGVTTGSSGHHFLGAFLSYYGLEEKDVELIDLEASQLSPALVNGDVDAIVTWQPHIYKAQKLLGINAIILSQKILLREDFYVVANKDFIQKNPETVEKLLRSLAKAERFSLQHPEESKEIVAQRLMLDQEFVDTVWNDFVFQLSLDQTIFLSLEEGARWAVKNLLVNATAIPNYFDFFFTDSLSRVKPGAVNIIGK